MGAESVGEPAVEGGAADSVVASGGGGVASAINLANAFATSSIVGVVALAMPILTSEPVPSTGSRNSAAICIKATAILAAPELFRPASTMSCNRYSAAAADTAPVSNDCC